MARKTFKEILNPTDQITGKAIIGVAKEDRKAQILTFVYTYGRGDQGLSEPQKQARIEKFIGSSEIEKVKGFGQYKELGVDISASKQNVFKVKPPEHDGEWDPIEKDIIDHISDYPRDLRCPGDDLRIVYIGVKDNGEMEIELLHNDSNIADHKNRAMSGVVIFDDETSARNEIQQFKKGELKEVSDRTMTIHAREDVLDILLEADNVDTDEDKEFQI